MFNFEARTVMTPTLLAGLHRQSSMLVRLLGLALVAAAGVGLSVALHHLWRVEDVLRVVLPFDSRYMEPPHAVVSAITFSALAVGLAERRRLSWVLSIILLVAAVGLQAAVLRHPVGAIVGAAMLAALLVEFRRFGVQSARRAVVYAFAVGLAFTVVVLDIAIVAQARVPIAATGRALADLAGAVTFTDLRSVTILDAHAPVLEVSETGVQLTFASLAILGLVAAPLLGVSGGSRERLLRVASRYGQGALLPHQIGRDKLAFAPPDLDAAVSFGRAGRFAVAVGDPVGAPAGAWEAFERFDEACVRSGLVPAVYQASPASRTRLMAKGFRTVLIGREAVLQLDGFSIAGSARANVRHTISRARRGGITIEVHLDGLVQADRDRLLPGLEAIERRWREKAGPELAFTIGRFDPAALNRTAIVVALEADGTPTAFATFLPTGVDGGWALDLMRRLPGGTPGAFEACVAAAAEAMRDRGAHSLSLGLAPLAGLSTTSPVWEERLIARLGQWVKPWYDVSGLEFFKAKFDPVWEPRYVAARSRLQLAGLVIALLRLHVGGFGHATKTAILGALR